MKYHVRILGLVFLLSGFSLFYLFADRIKSEQLQEQVVLNQQGRPCFALLQLLTLTGIEHDSSLESIVHATQKNWLRKPGSERWEMDAKNW
ncbi:hypothetical protein KBC04_05245 [Candidatus Babeliales bacterium]|nr:hypothetical protein [Candidatus Babeliales bacterium]MBP9844151.1 hypothetical protein [Candidatus Babeliales bacterium]